MVNTPGEDEQLILEDSDDLLSPTEGETELEGPEPKPGLNGQPVQCEFTQCTSRSLS